MTPTFTSTDLPLSTLAPYRDAPQGARFLCLGCYHTVSTVPGECGECGVALCDLADGEVRLQLRAEAERRLHERKWREEVPIASVALLLTALLVVLLGSVDTPLHRLLAVALFFPIQRAVTRAYAHLRRGTAIATFAARRLRLSGEIGADVQVAPSEPSDASLAANAGEDPEAMDTARLLEWIGVRLPGPSLAAPAGLTRR